MTDVGASHQILGPSSIRLLRKSALYCAAQGAVAGLSQGRRASITGPPGVVSSSGLVTSNPAGQGNSHPDGHNDDIRDGDE